MKPCPYCGQPPTFRFELFAYECYPCGFIAVPQPHQIADEWWDVRARAEKENV